MHFLSKTKTNTPEMDNETKITLGLLNMVHDNAQASQRSMADDLGIALGLANAYLKRCVKKGLIKISHAPANRYAYYLTPQGFSEKGRLTAEFLSQSLNLFRHARVQSAELFDQCQRNNWRRIVFFGASDLNEIFSLSARDYDVTLLAVVTHTKGLDEYAGLPVTSDPSVISDIDAVVICDIADPQGAYNEACHHFPRDRVLAPKFLGVVTNMAVFPDIDEVIDQ
jgi:DNA-binding MarR family transcriptional regulator